MARILGIDFGMKRCGLAVTDILQISVNPLHAVSREGLDEYLDVYIKKEDVEAVVIGKPYHADGTPMKLAEEIDRFGQSLLNRFPELSIHFYDESFTSRDASKILAQTNKKKTRRDKSKLDVMSAVLILQKFLHHI